MTRKTKPAELNLEALNRDFHYIGVDAEYHTEYHCEEYCRDEGICRCSTLEDIEITNVDLDYIVGTVLNGVTDPILCYCVDRVIRSFNLHQKDSWDAFGARGYYGEELCVKLDGRTTREIKDRIRQIQGLDDPNKVKQVLTWEYGYLLDLVKESNKCEILQLERQSLIIGARDHYKKLDQKAVTSYKDYQWARGIVVPDGDRYRLIDGYHRTAACDGAAPYIVLTQV
jgi:hypothetical protein